MDTNKKILAVSLHRLPDLASPYSPSWQMKSRVFGISAVGEEEQNPHIGRMPPEHPLADKCDDPVQDDKIGQHINEASVQQSNKTPGAYKLIPVDTPNIHYRDKLFDFDKSKATAQRKDKCCLNEKTGPLEFPLENSPQDTESSDHQAPVNTSMTARTSTSPMTYVDETREANNTTDVSFADKVKEDPTGIANNDAIFHESETCGDTTTACKMPLKPPFEGDSSVDWTVELNSDMDDVCDIPDLIIDETPTDLSCKADEPFNSCSISDERVDVNTKTDIICQFQPSRKDAMWGGTEPSRFDDGDLCSDLDCYTAQSETSLITKCEVNMCSTEKVVLSSPEEKQVHGAKLDTKSDFANKLDRQNDHENQSNAHFEKDSNNDYVNPLNGDHMQINTESNELYANAHGNVLSNSGAKSPFTSAECSPSHLVIESVVSLSDPYNNEDTDGNLSGTRELANSKKSTIDSLTYKENACAEDGFTGVDKEESVPPMSLNDVVLKLAKRVGKSAIHIEGESTEKSVADIVSDKSMSYIDDAEESSPHVENKIGKIDDQSDIHQNNKPRTKRPLCLRGSTKLKHLKSLSTRVKKAPVEKRSVILRTRPVRQTNYWWPNMNQRKSLGTFRRNGRTITVKQKKNKRTAKQHKRRSDTEKNYNDKKEAPIEKRKSVPQKKAQGKASKITKSKNVHSNAGPLTTRLKKENETPTKTSKKKSDIETGKVSKKKKCASSEESDSMLYCTRLANDLPNYNWLEMKYSQRGNGKPNETATKTLSEGCTKQESGKVNSTAVKKEIDDGYHFQPESPGESIKQGETTSKETPKSTDTMEALNQDRKNSTSSIENSTCLNESKVQSHTETSFENQPIESGIPGLSNQSTCLSKNQVTETSTVAKCIPIQTTMQQQRILQGTTTKQVPESNILVTRNTMVGNSTKVAMGAVHGSACSSVSMSTNTAVTTAVVGSSSISATVVGAPLLLVATVPPMPIVEKPQQCMITTSCSLLPEMDTTTITKLQPTLVNKSGVMQSNEGTSENTDVYHCLPPVQEKADTGSPVFNNEVKRPPLTVKVDSGVKKSLKDRYYQAGPIDQAEPMDLTLPKAVMLVSDDDDEVQIVSEEPVPSSNLPQQSGFSETAVTGSWSCSNSSGIHQKRVSNSSCSQTKNLENQNKCSTWTSVPMQKVTGETIQPKCDKPEDLTVAISNQKVDNSTQQTSRQIDEDKESLPQSRQGRGQKRPLEQSCLSNSIDSLNSRSDYVKELQSLDEVIGKAEVEISMLKRKRSKLQQAYQDRFMRSVRIPPTAECTTASVSASHMRGFSRKQSTGSESVECSYHRSASKEQQPFFETPDSVDPSGQNCSVMQRTTKGFTDSSVKPWLAQKASHPTQFACVTHQHNYNQEQVYAGKPMHDIEPNNIPPPMIHCEQLESYPNEKPCDVRVPVPVKPSYAPSSAVPATGFTQQHMAHPENGGLVPPAHLDNSGLVPSINKNGCEDSFCPFGPSAQHAFPQQHQVFSETGQQLCPDLAKTFSQGHPNNATQQQQFNSALQQHQLNQNHTFDRLCRPMEKVQGAKPLPDWRGRENTFSNNTTTFKQAEFRCHPPPYSSRHTNVISTSTTLRNETGPSSPNERPLYQANYPQIYPNRGNISNQGLGQCPNTQLGEHVWRKQSNFSTQAINQRQSSNVPLVRPDIATNRYPQPFAGIPANNKQLTERIPTSRHEHDVTSGRINQFQDQTSAVNPSCQFVDYGNSNDGIQHQRRVQAGVPYGTRLPETHKQHFHNVPQQAILTPQRNESSRRIDQSFQENTRISGNNFQNDAFLKQNMIPSNQGNPPSGNLRTTMQMKPKSVSDMPVHLIGNKNQPMMNQSHQQNQQKIDQCHQQNQHMGHQHDFQAIRPSHTMQHKTDSQYRANLVQPLFSRKLDPIPHTKSNRQSQRDGTVQEATIPSTMAMKEFKSTAFNKPENNSSSGITRETQNREDSNRATLAKRNGSCDKCGSKAVFLCSGCKSIWYCSRKCQYSGWEVHKTLCSRV